MSSSRKEFDHLQSQIHNSGSNAASRCDIPAIVFGTSITALGVLRTLSRRGIQTLVYTNPNDLVTQSKYYKPLIVPAEFQSPGASTDRFISIVRSLSFERAVLFPCTDTWTEAAAAIPEYLKKRFLTSLAPPETISILLDKGKLASVMSQLGLPHPMTVVSDDPGLLHEMDEKRFHGAFLKPRSSARFIEQYKVKALHVSTKAEAILKFNELQKAGFHVLLQEYIPGPPTEHYFIDGFIDRTGAVRAQFARQRLRMYPADFGNSTYMKSIAMDLVEPAMNNLKILFAYLNYRGIFSAEFKRDPRNGNFCLLEVNVRPWWYVEFAEYCGAPVCEMAYADALGIELPKMNDYKTNVGCAYPYFDLEGYFWYQRERKHGNLAALAAKRVSLASCVASWVRSKQPIFAWNDTGPVISNFRFLVKRFLKNHLMPRTK
ncbi:MAG: hypothetical protein ACKVS6_02015 [Planctomycetota bacterium]